MRVAAGYLPDMIIERRTEIDSPAGEVFAWHARPGAFERLVPPWESVRLRAPHPGLVEGSRALLRLTVGPVTTDWVARHERVEPGRGFVDVQEKGPFARWRHEHRFEPLDAGRSALVDRIDVELPGGPLGELAEPFVRAKLRHTLRFRHDVTAADLALHRGFQSQPRLTVAVTGASGLVGRALVALLTTGGHPVVRLVRRPAEAGEIFWDPDTGRLDPAALGGVDAVVHLAGESIADGRWTEERKRRIRSSRIAGTTTLARAIAAASPRPRVLISASAVGWYGSRGDEILGEGAPAGTGFLADVGQAWERATTAAREAGVRVVHARFGIILSPAGGALGKMLVPFSLGAGATLGTGRQWTSWISLEDCVGALVHLLQTDVTGPVNVVAPEPVTNAEYTKTLGRVLHRPAWFGVPAPVLRLLFGELADEGLLASTRVAPSRLIDSGYHFRHTTLTAALEHELGRGPV
ncbi:MAG: TIGR01777 family protein [Gemmatimonadetes bacterium]|nr:TIGR01777 family protein [Gemmatimonadota bacterium]